MFGLLRTLSRSRWTDRTRQHETLGQGADEEPTASTLGLMNWYYLVEAKLLPKYELGHE